MRLFSILLALVMLVSAFPMTASASTEITAVDVGVMEPSPGRNPNYSANVYTTGTVLDVESDTYGESTENGVTWFCGDVPMLPTDTFEPGLTYTVRVELVRESNDYAFRTNPAVDAKINGKNAYIQYGSYIWTTIEYTFPTIKGYTVTFDKGNGTGTMAPVENVAGNYTIPNCAFTAPTGKVFKSWKINGEEWFPGETYLVYGDITATAQWKQSSGKQEIFNIVATSEDMETIPTLYGRIRIPEFTIIEGAPAYINASTGNLCWQKKVGDVWQTIYDNRFTPGQWRISTSVRIDNDAASQYELGNPTTLTVNGQQWYPENGTGTPGNYGTYSFIFFYSPAFVIEDDPNVQPPVPVESVKMSLKNYTVGTAVSEVAITTTANANIEIEGFLEIIDENGDGQPDTLPVMATGTFSADKTYAIVVTITAKSGYDISGLTKEDVSLDQAALESMEYYDKAEEAFDAVYILKPPAENKAKITTQPKTAKVAAGKTAKFTVKATGIGLKYQWQSSTNGKSWKNCSSSTAKKATFTFTAKTSHSSNYYRCKVTDSAGNTVYTSAVRLYVLGVTIQPTTQKVAVGKTVKFAVAATGASKTYQWQSSADGKTWKNCSSASATKATFTFTAKTSHSSNYYRCRIKDSGGNTVYTDVVRLYVLGITTQPTAKTVTEGKTAKFTVAATGAGKVYQWQVSTDGGKTWKNCTSSSATKATFTFTGKDKHNGNYYRCRVKDNGGNTVYSNKVKLTVK